MSNPFLDSIRTVVPPGPDVVSGENFVRYEIVFDPIKDKPFIVQRRSVTGAWFTVHEAADEPAAFNFIRFLQKGYGRRCVIATADVVEAKED